MTTTMSFSKKQLSFLYFFSLKKSAGWTTIYSILLFLSYPVISYSECRGIFVRYDNTANYSIENIIYRLNNNLIVSDFIVSFLMCAMVMVFSGVLYSYMHNKRSADFFHSMPVKRETMLLANFFSGLTSVVVPIWVNSLIVCFIFPFVFKNIDCSRLFLLTAEKALAWTLGAFILLAITTLVAVCAATSVENLGYSVALMLEGSVLFTIWDMCCQAVFETYSSVFYNAQDIIGNVLYYLSPVFALARVIILAHEFRFIAWVPLLLWVVVGIAALYFALKFYANRLSELAEQWGRQSKIGFIVKLSSSIIGAFLFGTVFGALLELSIPEMFIFGSLVGAPLVYIIIEAITNRGFNNMKKCLPYMATAVAVTFALSLYFVFDGFGYDKRIPKADEVKTVTLEFANLSMPYDVLNDAYAENNYFDDKLYYYDSNDEVNTLEFSEPETIEIILDMHEDAVFGDYFWSNYLGRLDIEYEKNLGKQVRNIEVRTANQANHLALFYSDEYLKKYNPFFELKSHYLKEVVVSDKLRNPIDLIPKDIFDQLIIAIQQDLKNAEINDLLDTQNNQDVFVLEFNTKYPKEIFEEFSERYHFSTNLTYVVREKDVNTINLLTSLGFEKELSEDIKEDLLSAEFNFATYYHEGIPGIAGFPSTGVFEKDNYYHNYDNYERMTKDKDLIFDVLQKSSSVYNCEASQYFVSVFHPSKENSKEIYSHDFCIDRDALCEIMVKYNSFVAPYKFNDYEENVVYEAYESLYAKELNNNNYEVAMKSEWRNWHHRDDYETLKSSISMKDFCEQYCPEILEGKTSAELRCMQETPLISSENVLVYFD